VKNTQSIHSILALIVLLFLFISLLNQMIFAESNSTADNGMQKGMRSSPATSPEPPMIKGRCENTRIECSSLCQTDLSAETRAKELEEYSRKTRIDAAKVAQRAASIEKQANKKLRKMGLSVDTGGSGAANSNAKSAWKIVEIAPRLFVSNEARSRADKFFIRDFFVFLHDKSSSNILSAGDTAPLFLPILLMAHSSNAPRKIILLFRFQTVGVLDIIR
jgi:hypothetical protein